MIFINNNNYYLPGDLIELNTGNTIYVISVRIDKSNLSIYGITTTGDILTINDSDVSKIIKRQLPWNFSKSLCKYCGKPLKNLELCSDCPIKQGNENTLLLRDFLQKKLDVYPRISCIAEMSFIGVSQLAKIEKEELIKHLHGSLPMSFKYKDGSLEGLIYILENQEQFNLIKYIYCFPENSWHGEYMDDIKRSYEVFPAPKNSIKALTPEQYPCNWCIYRKTKDCELGDCNFKNNELH